jgi:hypothetical protein
MPSTLFTAFYDDVLPEAPGCVPAVALKAIRDAAIEFCHESRCWQVDHDMIPIEADEPNYTLDPPTDTYVVEIFEPIYWGADRKNLYLRNRNDLAALKIDTWESPTPLYLMQEDERTVRVVPIPTVAVAEGLRFRMAVKPTETATGLESRLYQEYRKEISCGALALLMAQIKKPYSDLNMAAIKHQMFQSYKNVTYNRVQRSYSADGSTRFTLK